MSNVLISTKKEIKKRSDILLKTFLYFSVFKFPLTIDEALKFCQYKTDSIQQEINYLVSKKLLFKIDSFYLPKNDKTWVDKRFKESISADKMLIKANKMSFFISQFPFVEAVLLSGSISKGVFKEDDDIDYFIITAPNRLWVSRTFLILFKKIFLLNSKKHFCVNYFVSSNALEIEEKNRFTATELTTLMPMTGNGIYNDFKNNNLWVYDFFPNFINNNKESIKVNNSILKSFLEYLLKGKFGTILEKYCMKITKSHQKNKFKKLKKSDFNLAFKGNKHTSKHHPDNHQVRVINLLNEKIIAFNKKYELSIPLEK
ncbi:hypothetical protein [Urechidicola croceus]|uniref:Polymerase nucleotidyl transferase domain-containing protein n=1 Tax=Urechidicola croceus TaxID=1850246 RepID=A0A1D8PAC4_9FLAO|nr:hypothetical protein [Urechidicola croceus]AOW21476.1 hypothetical protein LPB138_12645 [Urechidicola croceus]